MPEPQSAVTGSLGYSRPTSYALKGRRVKGTAYENIAGYKKKNRVGSYADTYGNMPINEVTGKTEPAAGTAEYVPIEAMLLPGTPAIKGLGNVGNFIVDALNPLAGMGKRPGLNKFYNPFNEVLDIHDLRLAYHNKSRILTNSEIKLLHKEGLGNPKNYIDVITKDIGEQNIGNAPMPDFNKTSIKELIFGKDYAKIDIPKSQPIKKNNNILQSSDHIIENPSKNYLPEQNINIPKKNDFKPFINRYSTNPFERTKTSRAADKWLMEYYNDPIAKKKFIDYGGTEEQWIEVTNTLDNPIKSKYKWGENQPGGIYNSIFEQASIPTNASIGTGIHEGVHKTHIGMYKPLSKDKTILPKLYNDLAIAVRENPNEVYPEIIKMKYEMGWTPKTKINAKMLDRGLKKIESGYSVPYKIKDKKLFLDIVNKAPVVAGVVGASSYLISRKKKTSEKFYDPNLQ